MGIGATTAKHVLLLLNFIFTILGLILIGFGIFILVSASENQVDHGENVAGGLIIALGVVILIIAIFGCLAIIHEARHRILIYITSLVILILLQLMMLSMASQGTRDGLSGSIQEGFDSLWKIEVEKEPGALAYYEDWLHCCGVNNTEDYHNIQHDIPKSCCKEHNCRIVANIYTDGCLAKFEEYLEGKMLTFKIVGWILVLAEIAGAVLAWIFFRSLKNSRRRNNVGWM